MDNMENMDFEAMRDKQADELMQLLDERRMKELQLRLEDMNEFDVAEFLSEIGDNRMPMVFRLLSKQMAADVFCKLRFSRAGADNKLHHRLGAVGDYRRALR